MSFFGLVKANIMSETEKDEIDQKFKRKPKKRKQLRQRIKEEESEEDDNIDHVRYF